MSQLAPEVEIELRSLHRCLRHLRQEQGWEISPGEILSLGAHGVDYEDLLDRRLLKSAAENDRAFSSINASEISKKKEVGGNPGKSFRLEMFFLVGFYITEERSPDVQIVTKMILDIATRRGWQMTDDTARGWAQDCMEWYERRET